MKENEELTDRKFNWRDGPVEKLPPAWGERLASNVSPPWPAWSSAWLAFFFPAGEKKIKSFGQYFQQRIEKDDLSLSVDSSSFFEMDANLSRSRATINQKTAERYISTFSSFLFLDDDDVQLTWMKNKMKKNLFSSFRRVFERDKRNGQTGSRKLKREREREFWIRPES